MIIRYWVNCFDRELCVKFTDGNAEFEAKVYDILDDSYYD